MKKITDERDPKQEAFEETAISFEDVLADQEENIITNRLSKTCAVIGTEEDISDITLEDFKNLDVPHHIFYADKPKFIDENMTLEEPLTYSRKD
jgi:hypothetical protein